MSSSTIVEPYHHKPLLSPRSIRVMRLKPASFNAPLHCSLVEASLDSVDTGPYWYEALSYVWGAPRGDREIFIDDDSGNNQNCKSLQITSNCETALQYLRTTGKVRNLWVDAICIDQSSKPRSIQERNTQVAIMGEIYEISEAVLVWLGVGGHATTAAMGYMNKIGKYYLLMPRKRSFNLAKSFKYVVGKMLLKRYSDKLIKHNQNSANFDSGQSPLTPVMQSSWHSRIWTVQEVAFGDICYVLCGHPRLHGYCQLSWDRFAFSVEHLMKFFQDNLEAPDLPISRRIQGVTIHNAMRLLTQTLLTAEYPQSSIEAMGVLISDFLDHVGFLEATNAKDKVYGLLSVLRLININIPEPDYSKSVEIIYEEAALAIMRALKSLRLFKYACTGDRSPKLPSWVPDWENEHRMIHHKGDPVYFGEAEIVCKEQGQLTLSGKEIDTIANRARADFAIKKAGGYEVEDDLQVLTGENYSIPDHESIRSLVIFLPVLKEWVYFTEGLTSYPTGDFVMNVLQNTLMLSSDINTTSREVLDMFFDMLKYPRCKNPGLSGAVQMMEQLATEDKQNQAFWTPDVRGSVAVALALGSEVYETIPQRTRLQQLVETISFNTRDRAFFFTHRGYMGTSFYTLQRGDRIVLFRGAKEPIIVRLVDQYYRLIGPAYIFGLMPTSFGDDDELDSFILI